MDFKVFRVNSCIVLFRFMLLVRQLFKLSEDKNVSYVRLCCWQGCSVVVNLLGGFNGCSDVVVVLVSRFLSQLLVCMVVILSGVFMLLGWLVVSVRILVVVLWLVGLCFKNFSLWCSCLVLSVIYWLCSWISGDLVLVSVVIFFLLSGLLFMVSFQWNLMSCLWLNLLVLFIMLLIGVYVDRIKFSLWWWFYQDGSSMLNLVLLSIVVVFDRNWQVLLVLSLSLDGYVVCSVGMSLGKI